MRQLLLCLKPYRESLSRLFSVRCLTISCQKMLEHSLLIFILNSSHFIYRNVSRNIIAHAVQHFYVSCIFSKFPFSLLSAFSDVGSSISVHLMVVSCCTGEHFHSLYIFMHTRNIEDDPLIVCSFLLEEVCPVYLTELFL